MTVGIDGQSNVAAMLYARSRQQRAAPQKFAAKPPMAAILENVDMRNVRRDSSKPAAGAAAAIVSARRRSSVATPREHSQDVTRASSSTPVGTVPRAPDGPPSHTSGRHFRRPASPAVILAAALAPKGVNPPSQSSMRPPSPWRESASPDASGTRLAVRVPDLAAVSLYAAARATLGIEEFSQSADEKGYSQSNYAAREAIDQKSCRYPTIPVPQQEDRPVARPTPSSWQGAGERCVRADSAEGTESAATLAYSAFQDIASPPRPEISEEHAFAEDRPSTSSASSSREGFVSSRSVQNDPCTVASQLSRSSSRGCRPRVPNEPDLFAEKWLRLCRIALLELGKLPPAHRLVSCKENCKQAAERASEDIPAVTQDNKWMSMAFPNSDGDDALAVGIGGERELTMNRPLQAWARILTRAFGVTMRDHWPADDDEDDDEDEQNAHYQCDETSGRKGHALICLGDMMNESISWIEVDSDEDCHTPKAVNLQEAMQEVCEEQEVAPIPSAMKNIYRQQNAPGIVQGMNKCLSF